MSAFAQLASQAHSVLEGVFGDVVSIDGIPGVAIVTPQDDMMLANGIEMVGGAHLLFRDADFPDAAVQQDVVHGDKEYTLIELDDVDTAGIRHARLAPA